jgi:hypothetical protein
VNYSEHGAVREQSGQRNVAQLSLDGIGLILTVQNSFAEGWVKGSDTAISRHPTLTESTRNPKNRGGSPAAAQVLLRARVLRVFRSAAGKVC